MYVSEELIFLLRAYSDIEEFVFQDRSQEIYLTSLLAYTNAEKYTYILVYSVPLRKLYGFIPSNEKWQNAHLYC